MVGADKKVNPPGKRCHSFGKGEKRLGFGKVTRPLKADYLISYTNLEQRHGYPFLMAGKYQVML